LFVLFASFCHAGRACFPLRAVGKKKAAEQTSRSEEGTSRTWNLSAHKLQLFLNPDEHGVLSRCMLLGAVYGGVSSSAPSRDGTQTLLFARYFGCLVEV